MATTNGAWNWPSFVSAVLVSVTAAAIVQSMIMVRWSGVVEERLNAVQADARSNTERLAQIDVAGTRNVPVLNERTAALEKADKIAEMRLDALAARVEEHIRDYNALNIKTQGLEGGIKALRDITDQRGKVVERAERAFEDIASLKSQIAAMQYDLNQVRRMALTSLDRLGQLRAPSSTRQNYEDRW